MVRAGFLLLAILASPQLLSLSGASGSSCPSSTHRHSQGDHHHAQGGEEDGHHHHHRHSEGEHHHAQGGEEDGRHHHHRQRLPDCGAPPHSSRAAQQRLLPEELAEEEDLKTFVSESHASHRPPHHHDLSVLGIWLRAIGCSLLVSLASLICLMLLPLIVSQGKPSQVVVDSLAAFGAGAMLGDAFLHQLPHALGTHSHSHGSEEEYSFSSNHEHIHNHFHSQGHTPSGGHNHAHSIHDMSVGLAVLAGIILFFIVEKVVRLVEELSGKRIHSFGHSHHHHSHHLDEGLTDNLVMDKCSETRNGIDTETVKDMQLDEKNKRMDQMEPAKTEDTALNKLMEVDAKSVREEEIKPLIRKSEIPQEDEHSLTHTKAPSSNLVLGYLNLFSDGVHNFTDGMALGSAFLLHGTIGGWSRTLFLLAHEIPQEVGDFGILVRSGFGVFKALAFNFLSALVALAGTTMALLFGGSPTHSSWIEGFTAGGFIYIAVAGVLPEMHQQKTTMKTSIFQLASLCLGMLIALGISIME